MKVKFKIRFSSLRERPKKSEVDNLKCDNSKIVKYTNWKSKIKLNEGLIKTVNWYLKNSNRITLNQYL